MKKLLSLALILSLAAIGLPALAQEEAAQEAIPLPALDVSITPGAGQTLTLADPAGEEDGDNTPAPVLYATLSDATGTEMRLWLVENEAWMGLDLLQSSQEEQMAIADWLIYGADYLRLSLDNLPDTMPLQFGNYAFLGITHQNEDGDQVDSVFSVLPGACLYCTFNAPDGGVADPSLANALLDPIYSLAPLEEAAPEATDEPEAG